MVYMWEVLAMILEAIICISNGSKLMDNIVLVLDYVDIDYQEFLPTQNFKITLFPLLKKIEGDITLIHFSCGPYHK